MSLIRSKYRVTVSFVVEGESDLTDDLQAEAKLLSLDFDNRMRLRGMPTLPGKGTAKVEWLNHTDDAARRGP